jgi:hypothetical protein
MAEVLVYSEQKSQKKDLRMSIPKNMNPSDPIQAKVLELYLQRPDAKRKAGRQLEFWHWLEKEHETLATRTNYYRVSNWVTPHLS